MKYLIKKQIAPIILLSSILIEDGNLNKEKYDERKKKSVKKI